jgi:hypothetical protein
MVDTIRTTFTIRPGLFERLKRFSREQGKPMSEVVEEGISQVIEQHEQERIQKMYEGLSTLVGMSKAPIPDASQRIDEILYGEQGAWRGHAA